MVSIVSERWPDTVLPTVCTCIGAKNVVKTSVFVAPQHLYHAWGQLSLELAKVPCQVVCYFKEDEPLQKTFIYGSRSLPLRIHDNITKCNVRGILSRAEKHIDLVCVSKDEKFDCFTGYRVNPSKISRFEIRTQTKILCLEIHESECSSFDWFGLEECNTLSCWLWSVCHHPNKRICNRQGMLEEMIMDGMISDKHINMLM